MPEIDWNKLKTLEYWLAGFAGNTAITPTLEMYSFFFWTFISIFSIVFSIGVGFKVSTAYFDPNNPLVGKFNIFGNNLIWVGIMGMSWFLFRQIQVGFLGARFWLLVLGIWVVGLGVYAGRYFALYYKFENLYFQKVLKTGKKS